ncbi:DUF262 domain-containing protein [Rhizobium leguminosarum]|uniref:DUF262 domain-containing protein n=1 Tax=Rhizobium leguminosarum TaxID=384 RepID=UPI001C97C3C3|nr:DUF262 domain-containing protein [Rhizobium leguminosarum]MBY5572201.1 DUF262 domain-containing protein [Rhizobium leguminosarum]MBY5578806.1 DUF262 domain-containing protein [Rhizobium leguminosarum]
MKAFSSPMAVGDYCNDMILNKIVVNPEYQRSPKIWKGEARSFFIESIILGYPIPKLFLHSKIVLKTKQSIKEIVDGQQRSMALRDFFNNKLRLSKNIETEELRGKTYNLLADEFKEAFLSYSLPLDQFTGVSDSSVREAFRRMNSNNVPLNEEEKRHARYQGPFKWFVNALATEYKDRFLDAGVLSARDFIRMSDYKLITDIVYAIIHGILTTKSKELDSIYSNYDKEFPQEEALTTQMKSALDAALDLGPLKSTDLCKPYIFYTLVLAHAARQQATIELQASIQRGREHAAAAGDIDQLDLTDLIELLDGSEVHAIHPFVKACSEKTNVKEPREVRLAYLHAAIGRPVEQ